MSIDIKQHIKDIIIDALSCAADNANDKGMGDYDLEYAIGTIAMEIVWGEPDERIENGYFDCPELNDREITRGECRPHLVECLSYFLNHMTDYGVLKEGGSK